MTRSRLWVVIVAACCVLSLGLSGCRGEGTSAGKPKAPTIVSLVPSQGPETGGTDIIIETDHFAQDFTSELPDVTFGGSLAAVVAVDSTALTATTPSSPIGVGSVDVEVIARNGQSALKIAGYAYLPVSPPCTVAGVTPSSGLDAGGYDAIISGADFENDPATIVTFDGYPATGFQYFSDTQISCTVPPYPHGSGWVDVEVTSSKGSCILPSGFEYLTLPCCCMIQQVLPNTGPLSGGTTVQILGTGFDQLTYVTFGGVVAPNFQFLASSLITCDTPPDPLGIPGGDYDVEVCVITWAYGTCCWPDAFHYESASSECSIHDIIPRNGIQGGGTPVTITGDSFLPLGLVDPEVTFGGIPGAVTFASNTQIDVVTPASPVSGPVDVEIVNENSETCSERGGFSYDPP